mgnify:CR=1 FL=1
MENYGKRGQLKQPVPVSLNLSYQPMKNPIVCILIFLSFSVLCSGADKAGFPSFSWDVVPRYMHVRKAKAFSKDEIKYLATFPLITFEKSTGSREFRSTEQGTLEAAKAVKRVNSDAKILYYRNILVHYDMYAADRGLRKIDDPFLTNKRGDTKLVRSSLPAYDLTNRKLQDWWLDNAKELCASRYIDGIFIDGNIKVLEPNYLTPMLGAEQREDVVDAYHDVLRKLRHGIDRDKLIIANIIRARLPDAGAEHLRYFDGSYIEGFEHAVKGYSREEYMAKGIEAIQSAARSGKIIAFTIAMGDNSADAGSAGIDESRKRVSEWSAAVQQRFIYSLALFLICAEEHSYFMANDGYGVDDGKSVFWMDAIPEYSYPLGAPKGRAKQRGYTYTRKFEFADVSIDLVSESATIQWHAGSASRTR